MTFFALFSRTRCLLAVGLLGWAMQGMAQGDGEWRQVCWMGEKAWEATSSGWTAVVSEERARLISMAPVGGENLLYAPAKGGVSWGGHRFWLGPQSQWLATWPPPADWEAAACAEVKVSGKRLEFLHPHADARYPRLARAYFWSGGVLHCEACWQGDRHHAVQILQMPRWAIVHLHRAVSKGLPEGYVLLPLSKSEKKAIVAGVSRMEGEDVTLWHANVSEKVGFFPQEIAADVGGYRLVMRRGEGKGLSATAPDQGLLSQVYLGDWQNPFVEIEQISQYGNGGPSMSEVLIEPVRLNQ